MKRFNLRWSISTILAVVAFQLVFGTVVFMVTRNHYNRAPVPEVAMPQGNPHGVPARASAENPVLLPGSERVTVEDARKMVKAEPAGSEPTYGGGSDNNPEELARVADQHFREGLYQRSRRGVRAPAGLRTRTTSTSTTISV